MGIFAQVAVLEGKRWNPVMEKEVVELGWDFETGRQMTTGYRKALREFLDEEGFMHIETKKMQRAMFLVANTDEVVHANMGFDPITGMSREEKSNFIEIAILCQKKGWSIIAG